MRAAPAVDAALDAGGRERMLIVLLHAWAGVGLACWLAAQAGAAASVSVVALVLLAGAAWAAGGAWLARRALPLDPGHLRWDGQAWWHGGEHLPLARVVVSLDFGTRLLLRLHPAAGGGRARWRVASAASAAAAWHGLRVALAAHAGAVAEPGGADHNAAGPT
jgi:hypothetical protein